MKFFTEEDFRNKLIALLGVLVLFLSQAYVAEVLNSKDAYKGNLYISFKAYVEEIENLDIYLSELSEIKSIDEIKPKYLEESIILLFEQNISKVTEIKKEAFPNNYYEAIFSYTDINKNLGLIRQDNIISDIERRYLDELYKSNHANLEYAAKLIKYYSTDYQDIDALEKNIFDTYIDYVMFLGENYKAIDLKSEESAAKTVALEKDKVRERLQDISKKLTGNDSLSYYKEPYVDESEIWTYVTRDNPGKLERTDEDIYTFDYTLDENKVSFYKSLGSIMVSDEEPMRIFKEDKMKALADEHAKNIDPKSEFVKVEKHEDDVYMDFFYQRKNDGIYYEANSITVTVDNEGSIYSEFYLRESEAEINWIDEKTIKEKLNSNSEIKAIIKVINVKNQAEYLVMTEYNKEKFISVFDGETAKLKIYDRLDQDKYLFYYNILI